MNIITSLVLLFLLISSTIGLNEDPASVDQLPTQEEKFEFHDGLTIEDYCNTEKGKADVFCKHEL